MYEQIKTKYDIIENQKKERNRILKDNASTQSQFFSASPERKESDRLATTRFSSNASGSPMISRQALGRGPADTASTSGFSERNNKLRHSTEAIERPSTGERRQLEPKRENYYPTRSNYFSEEHGHRESSPPRDYSYLKSKDRQAPTSLYAQDKSMRDRYYEHVHNQPTGAPP